MANTPFLIFRTECLVPEKTGLHAEFLFFGKGCACMAVNASNMFKSKRPLAGDFILTKFLV